MKRLEIGSWVKSAAGLPGCKCAGYRGTYRLWSVHCLVCVKVILDAAAEIRERSPRPSAAGKGKLCPPGMRLDHNGGFAAKARHRTFSRFPRNKKRFLPFPSNHPSPSSLLHHHHHHRLRHPHLHCLTTSPAAANFNSSPPTPRSLITGQPTTATTITTTTTTTTQLTYCNPHARKHTHTHARTHARTHTTGKEIKQSRLTQSTTQEPRDLIKWINLVNERTPTPVCRPAQHTISHHQTTKPSNNQTKLSNHQITFVHPAARRFSSSQPSTTDFTRPFFFASAATRPHKAPVY